MTRIGVVTGLETEARLIRRQFDAASDLDPLILCAGPGRGAEGAARLVDKGVAGLVSFGLAGGLDPAILAGDLICPDMVLDEDGTRYPTDAQWRDRLETEARLAGLSIRDGALFGSSKPISDPPSRARHYREFGAVAVDMESHGVAATARQADLPFLALRAVADSADRAVPPSALKGIDAQGRTRILPVLGALCGRPQDLPALIALSSDMRSGMAALGDAAGLGSLAYGLL